MTKKAKSVRKLKESSVQEALTNYYTTLSYSVIREAKTPVGFIDLLAFRGLEKVIVEVKELSSIKHAIGQVLAYREYHRDATKLVIVYFCRDGLYRKANSIYIANRYGIEIKSINELIDVGEIIECQNKKLISHQLVTPQLESLREESLTYSEKSMKSWTQESYQSKWEEEYPIEIEILDGRQSSSIIF